jgi:hypothetical protein
MRSNVARKPQVAAPSPLVGEGKHAVRHEFAWVRGWLYAESCSFPSPLASAEALAKADVGEGGGQRPPDEGARSFGKLWMPRQPLTQANLWLVLALPSPTRGEGAAMGGCR